MSRSSLACLLLAALSLLPVSASARERERSLAINGAARNYTLIEPDRNNTRLPLLIVYHGGGQTADAARAYTRFDEYADTDNMVVVYPQGLGNFWNDGRRSPDLIERAAASTNDLEFTSQIIGQLAGEGLVDPAHVFVAGASNGGVMAMYAGCKLNGRIAGIAVVIANLPPEWTCDAARLPALFVHGTEDTYMPFAGGRVAKRFVRRDLGVVLSAEATVNRFREIDGCSGVKETKRIDNVGRDETVAVYTEYECSRGPLKWFVVDGGGHTWPGARASVVTDLQLGRTTEEFSATGEILDFIKALR